MRTLPEVTAYEGEAIVLTAPDGSLIGQIEPATSWRLVGDRTLYDTPDEAIEVALQRHTQKRSAR